MKTTPLALLCLLAVAGLLSAAQPVKRAAASPDFERLKTLVGTWKGTADMGQGANVFTVEYRLVSGGTVLEERTFAGTPKEMVTMYYARQGKLRLTHYCMLGNQPSMVLKSADAKSLKFDFDPACGLPAKSETHMHSLTITFQDTDSVTQAWVLFERGKAQQSHPLTLKRVKA